MNIFSNLWKKLQVKGYRKAFVDSQLKRGVPFQIRALRLKRGWSQEELAKKSGLTQGVISRAENPDYGNLTFNTVLEIAGGLDVAFVGWFVPFSELAQWYERLSEDSVQVLTFTEEDHRLRQEAGRPDRGTIATKQRVRAQKDDAPLQIALTFEPDSDVLPNKDYLTTTSDASEELALVG